MKLQKKLIFAIAVALAAVVALIAYIVWENSSLTVTEYTHVSKNLPQGFDGFRVVQVSDLHAAEFGEDNEALLDAIKGAKPDLIVITGDLFDTRHGENEIGTSFAEKAAKLAPTCFVTGNHEHSEVIFNELAETLTESMVTVLRDECITLTRGSDTITIAGIDDPRFLADPDNPDAVTNGELISDALPEVMSAAEGYTLLLAHRPEHFELYAESGADLVLCGHAHGGQFRLPFVGGLYAPGQGILPEYTEGMHMSGGTTMIVSRGLGNSTFPFRFNNAPELVLITLACEQ